MVISQVYSKLPNLFLRGQEGAFNVSICTVDGQVISN